MLLLLLGVLAAIIPEILDSPELDTVGVLLSLICSISNSDYYHYHS